MGMEACSSSSESSDGRTVFSMTPGGQLKMPRLNVCLLVTPLCKGFSQHYVSSVCPLVLSNTTIGDTNGRQLVFKPF